MFRRLFCWFAHRMTFGSRQHRTCWIFFCWSKKNNKFSLKVMLAIPIVSIPVMIAFPAALGVYWVSITSFWSILKRDYNMSFQAKFTVFVSFLHHGDDLQDLDNLVMDEILIFYKDAFKVTNNFISLCQSRILRIPAVSLIWNCEIVLILFFRWDNPVVSLKLSNGNQRSCPWQHLWWVITLLPPFICYL